MKEILKEATIQSKAVFSKDGKHRYLLERVWNEQKKKATIIMINPSIANELKTDITVCKVMNFLIDKDFGALRIVNLYSFISTDPSCLLTAKDATDESNDQYIKNATRDSDIVIIAWGIEKNKYKKRKEQVKNMLKDHKIKTKGFIDSEGRVGRHPSRLNEFTLENYTLE
jgi:hypothetical protein